MNVWRHLAAVLLLPGVVTVGMPALIVRQTEAELTPFAVLGIPLIALGLVFVIWTVSLFERVGRGTLAPWDSTKRLVVRGPYRHVRNPMISGVLSILLGEAALFGSIGLLVLFAAVFAVNAVYLPLVEERGLSRRFGNEYATYKDHVPRWIPRLGPWTPEETAG